MFASIIISILVGLSLGSFVNACVYRIPIGITIISVRSFCPNCRIKLSWKELIPVLSFIVQGGRCRSCKGTISWRYPIVELVVAIVAVFLFIRHGFTLELLQIAIYFLLMIIIVLIDWEHLIIPNNIILVGIGMGILIFIPSGWETVGLRMLASFICMVFMLSVRLIGNQLLKREAMGFGDVKLASLVGFFLEFQNFLIALWLAAILGTMYGIVKHVQRKKQQIPVTNHPTEISFKLPFGSFLAFASVIVIIFQEQIQNLIDSWLIFNL